MEAEGGEIKKIKVQLLRAKKVKIELMNSLKYASKLPDGGKKARLVFWSQGDYLKGVLEDYTWGYHRKPLDYPFS